MASTKPSAQDTHAHEQKGTWPRASKEEVHAFMTRCLVAAGLREEDADALATLLVAADYRGHPSHGLNRLEIYLADIKIGRIKTNGTPEILKQNRATAWVDGNSLVGPVVGKFCIDLAIQKAKDPEVGIGWVCAKGSNHFGIAGWYSERAADEGLLGMAFTNTSPVTVPTRASKKSIGTLPLSLVANGEDKDRFFLDMATTTVALGKVEMADLEHKPIPHGWAVDRHGKECSDPHEVVFGGGGLMPLGGSEQTGGYKGYGLGLMVEIFCGILSGANYGPNIYTWQEAVGESNLGQCFVAINPECFAPGFSGRLSDLLNICRNLPPAEGESQVLVPGDPEEEHMKSCDLQGGITYHPNQIIKANKIAEDFGVAPLVLHSIRRGSS